MKSSRRADRFYNYYVNDLKWVDKDKSFATKYKFLFFVIGGNGGTAFGGSIDNKIGAFWTPATRINRGPYGVVAHELGHSFQALVRADGAASFSGGSIHEMTSQWMLWQVYPEWMTFENYHLNAFMKATHLAFLHEDNQYHTCYPLEYWSEKHGIEFIGKMWREVQRGEDPVMTYKRLTGITQEQFNDEMFDAVPPLRHLGHAAHRKSRRPIRQSARHQTSQSSRRRLVPDRHQQLPAELWLQCHQTQSPRGRHQSLPRFQRHRRRGRLPCRHPERAGWRYGFLASKEDGSRVYSDTFSKSPGTAEFTVPANTKFLWLVVMGAPTEHWIHVGSRGGGRGGRGGPTTNTNATSNTIVALDATNTTAIAGTANTASLSNFRTNAGTMASINRGGAASNANEQWPYCFKLTGTTPDDSIVH